MAGPSRFDFVNAVAADRDLVVTSSHEHACRVEPRASELAWHCDLDDGTPTDSDKDPASSVRWVCPALRMHYPAAEADPPTIDVRRTGPHSDLGKLVQGLGRLLGRTPQHEDAGRYAYTDPAGIIDADLRHRIEHWPTAPHGDGVVRPAELWAIDVTHEGLTVTSVSWWDSAPALDHQIALAADVAARLAARR